jgi:hypothetical protein
MATPEEIAAESWKFESGPDGPSIKLTAGLGNGFDTGMQGTADNLEIRTVTSIDGQHAEEDLLLDNKDTLWPLERVASDNQGACGPEWHDCAGQMDDLGIEHN